LLQGYNPEDPGTESTGPDLPRRFMVLHPQGCEIRGWFVIHTKICMARQRDGKRAIPSSGYPGFHALRSQLLGNSTQSRSEGQCRKHRGSSHLSPPSASTPWPPQHARRGKSPWWLATVEQLVEAHLDGSIFTYAAPAPGDSHHITIFMPNRGKAHLKKMHCSDCF
jgi:hypothetical protein